MSESGKKKAILDLKQSILNDIKLCEKRIQEVQSRSRPTFPDDDSSDSDSGLPVRNSEASSALLSFQQTQLQVCLQATVELTNLQILESEVNVLVDPPLIESGDAPTEAGLWREVASECRVDLIPFTVTFHIHQPSRQYAAPTFHNLLVSAVKSAHQKELERSVLRTVKNPGDAVQLVRSYAQAHRSRRSSLASLADKYADQLYMEAAPEGGYLLKCGDMMEVAWRLQNKWSPIAPFHHRMKFEIGFMDEPNLKVIRQAHQQLIDPTIDTEERTYYLSKIIDTCLSMVGPQSAYEESDTDTDKMNRTRTTLDQEPDFPPDHKNGRKKKSK